METIQISVLSLFKDGKIKPIAIYTKDLLYNIVEIVNVVTSEQYFTFECMALSHNTVVAIRIQYNSTTHMWYMP